MRLGFLLLCDSSEALNGKLYALGGGWNNLRVPAFPTRYGFGISLGLDVAWAESDQEHHLELHVEDPDGDRLADPFQFEFETGRPASTIEGQEQRIVLSLGSTFEFHVAGPHAVVVSVDGEEVGRSRFYVSVAPPPDG
jgi:hypothetical protein